MHNILKVNEEITYSGRDVIDVLNEINIILISLHNMGTYYYSDTIRLSTEKQTEYEKETTRFIDEWQVTKRLAQIRRVLSEKYDDSLGDDDMDDLERAAENLKYWEKPGDKP